jgi:hypothetical protein
MPLCDAVSQAYCTIAVPLDELPYTPEFAQLISLIRSLVAASEDLGEHRIWRYMLWLRKRGKLPRLGRRRRDRP